MVSRVSNDPPPIPEFADRTWAGESVQPIARIATGAVLPDNFPISSNLQRNVRKIVGDENVVVFDKLHACRTADARFVCPQVPQQPALRVYLDDVDVVH